MDVWAIIRHNWLSDSWLMSAVAVILILLSVASWAVMFSKWWQWRMARRAMDRFEPTVIHQKQWMTVYEHWQHATTVPGMARLFCVGLSEALKHRLHASRHETYMLQRVERAMDSAAAIFLEDLSQGLSFLATVASIAPYIGLFGTVCGIMQAIGQLATVTQGVGMSVVAPGIARALIATALGLWTAVPAMIAYNHFTKALSVIVTRLTAFESRFLNELTLRGFDD